jgi:hypothetical protein
VNAVLIRASTDVQDRQSQTENVTTMLAAGAGAAKPEDRGRWQVSPEHWYDFVSPRSDVLTNPRLCELLELVKADEIERVYIEKFDRLGTDNPGDLLTLIGGLNRHNTSLWDLTASRECASWEIVPLLLNIVGVSASRGELEAKGQSSLRGRVGLFKDTGSWPCGVQPFGYAKRCDDKDGKKVLWEWHPTTRTRGDLYEPKNPDGTGRLVLKKKDVPIPRKEKGARQRTRLIPGRKEHRKIVELIFRLYVGEGLSRRQICHKLNAAGHRLYDRPFVHPVVTGILRNPAYTGTTYFGQRAQSKYYRIADAEGGLQKVDVPKGKKKFRERRRLADCLRREGSHDALIDRQTFDKAQARLAREFREHAEGGGRGYVRNPAYYLRPILHCGHCGKPLSGRTANDPLTGEPVRCYVCPSFIRGKSNGHPVSCRYYRISHQAAEKLLLDKARELRVEIDDAREDGLRKGLDRDYAILENEQDLAAWERHERIVAGADAFVDFVGETYQIAGRRLERLRKAAAGFYKWGTTPSTAEIKRSLPSRLKDFRKAIEAAEQHATADARSALAGPGSVRRARARAVRGRARGHCPIARSADR